MKQMPDITLAQIVAALLGGLFPVLTLLGVDLDAAQRDALDNLKFIALGLFGADAAIRVGRNLGTLTGQNGTVIDGFLPEDGDDSELASETPKTDG